MDSDGALAVLGLVLVILVAAILLRRRQVSGGARGAPDADSPVGEPRSPTITQHLETEGV